MLVARLAPMYLVEPAVQVGPIDRLLVLVVAMTVLNRHHSRTLLVQLVGYLVVPIAKLPAEAEPMGQVLMMLHPTAAVRQGWLLPYCSRKQAVEESDLVCPSQQLIAVEQGFALPMDFVAVEQASVDPNQEFVVEESDLVYPSQRLAVEQVSVDPNLLVAVERPMLQVAGQVGSRNLLLVYSPAGSTREEEPVVPGVADLMKQ